METKKVNLYVSTPFTLKDKNSRNLLLMVCSMTAMTIALIVASLWIYSTGNEGMIWYAIAGAMLLVLGDPVCALLFFCSYLVLDDGDLIFCRMAVLKQRIPRGTLEKAVREGEMIRSWADGKVVVSVPDSPAAHSFLTTAKIPLEK